MIRKFESAGFVVILATAAFTCGACRPVIAEYESAAPLIFYASQSGMSTLDQGEGGGNPFASALIELLQRSSLTYAELRSDLVTLTKEKSRDFQVPEVTDAVVSAEWRLKPIPASARRVALVFVYSDYSNVGVPSLPGADRDLKRVAAALKAAGFEVQTATDPARDDLRAMLEAFSALAEDSEAAVIYLTGHGFENSGQVYLTPNDYPFDKGSENLSERAVHVQALVDFLKAEKANIVFFGGCRSYM